MRVLITGAAGFIGSHLMDRLEQYEVYGLDNYETGSSERMKKIQTLDVADRHMFYDFANVYAPELVIHCAASYSDPNKWHRDTDTNVTGSINAALVAKHHGARLIYFQTALPPVSSYAISKIAGEQYLNLSGVPLLTFRLANIYGPRNLSGPIPTFYKRLSEGLPCTVVDTERELVYIDDLVELVMLGIESEKIGRYDVCSGKTSSIKEMYELVRAQLDGPEAEEISRGEDDVAKMDLEPSITEAVFGWTPTTALADGIEETVAWYREHGVGETYTHLRLKA